MSFRLGLTGSIGMGKSTTAKMFADLGCAVWDADAAVHRLYSAGGLAVAPMAERFPDAIEDGAVSRDRLKRMISHNSAILKQIEAIVHPLVAADREAFLERSDADISVLDIPLLFETGADKSMDAVVVVNVAPAEQKRRLAERGSMTQDQIETIISMQVPNTEKCAMADYVIETDTLEHARAQVHSVVQDIRAGLSHA